MGNKILPHDHGHLPKGVQISMPKGETCERAYDIFKMMRDSKRITVSWLL